ncbi:MAG: ABC transporter ATP-binding protein, partial [Candidatus Methanomethylophilaceae archaeon]|nr:ABC transporter ATP-binding protein [Candidatus Methanomethylophilaceae archaeon]
MAEEPIEIVNLRREFGAFVAVDDLNLSIKRNSFTGLLGPNGAGKSTTLKILTNLIHATSGSAYLNGIDVVKDPSGALADVGTVVETPEFYPYLTPRQTLKYIGEIIGMSSESIKAQTEEILEKVKMEAWGDKKLGTFSKGMRQRIALGQALLNEPKVIILDEPTSGLDPRGMAEMREILKNLRKDTNDLTI